MAVSRDRLQNVRSAATCVKILYAVSFSIFLYAVFLINLLHGIAPIIPHAVKLARWAIFKLLLLACSQAERNIKQFLWIQKYISHFI